ncbi:MAG TPA: GreA/GreB family elongation factor [Kofleriaceae bacterium]|nr:GreA/GreB family elongation factor [Kofleriaceae bacterium]
MAGSKATLKAGLLTQLETQLTAARRAHEAAASAATDDEARPENDKDTRGLEQSYLARGHAQRVAELETAIAIVETFAPRAFRDSDPIALGAVITIDEDEKSRTLWLAPHGGGIELSGGVTVVTPTSPLGKALLGKRVDDEIELGKRTLTVTDVA